MIDGDVGIGELQVVNSRSDFDDWDQHDRFNDRFDFGHDDGPATVARHRPNANAACTEAA